jgi:hypothetical protein
VGFALVIGEKKKVNMDTSYLFVYDPDGVDYILLVPKDVYGWKGSGTRILHGL